MRPNFERTQNSPKLVTDGPGITISISPGMDPQGTRVDGAYRVAADDRAELAPGPVRPQVWLVAIGRDSRVVWLGQPGGQAVVFADDEAEGDLEGWFQVSLGDCCDLPAMFDGTLDVIAVLGPWSGESVSVRFRV